MNPVKPSLTWLLALGLGANALWMLADPRLWYDSIPGVALTGGFNQHFVRDIGCAYLACALALAWRARDPGAWPAALLAALFLLLHGGLHVSDLMLGRCTPAGFVRDVPAVILPALLALWLASPGKPGRIDRMGGPASAPAASNRHPQPGTGHAP